MSDFIHAREHLDNGNVVVLNCDTQCNFMLLDDINFGYYKIGQGYKYFGGLFKMFPAKIVVPHTGYWNIILDLAGGKANIHYRFSVIK